MRESPLPARERLMFSRIRWRLAALNVVILTVILAFLESGVYVVLSRSMYDRVDSTLISRAEQVMRTGQMRDPLRSMIFPSRVAGAVEEGLFFLILDEKGVVVINPQAIPLEEFAGDGAALAPAAAGMPDLRTVGLENGQRVRIYTVAMRGDSGRVTGLLQVGRPLAAEEHALRMLELLFLGGGLFWILLSAVGGLFLAERALVPIRQAFRRQRDFVADASHELRTPLTLIRANAEMIARHPDEPVGNSSELLQDILGETDRLSALVTDLLTLARADAGQERLSVQEVRLDEIILDSGRQFKPLADERGIVLTIRAGSPVFIQGDPARLRQLMVILLDNALKHTPAGGVIEAECEISRSAGKYPVQLRVTDSGEGIAPQHLPHVFERFYRADPARAHDGSAGLGLAIAQWIVAAHRGRIHVSSTLGAGTTFLVQLPLQ
jgi:signal transduction histidine kinase